MHQMPRSWIQSHRKAVGGLLGLLIVAVFHWSFLINISHPLSLDHGDAFLITFILRHYVETVRSGHWASIANLPMFFGYDGTLFFTETFGVQALPAIPIAMLTDDIVATTHLVMILTVAASFILMYLLAWRLTNQILPSLLAAVVFTLNPFMSARFPDHLSVLSVQFLLAWFLCFEISVGHMKKGNSSAAHRFHFLAFVMLTFQVLGATLYYSVFTTVMLPLYAILRVRQEHIPWRAFLNRGFMIGALILMVTAMATAALYVRAHRGVLPRRSVDMTEYFSAWPTDWLFTGSQNRLYGTLKATAEAAFPTIVRTGIESEHSLFPGVVVLVVSALGFRLLHRSPSRVAATRVCRSLTILAAVAFLLSFGPTIHLSSPMSIPGPYALLRAVHPLFSFLRVPARFAVFVFLALGLTSAVTLTSLGSRWSSGKRHAVGMLILLLVLTEYWNKPLAFAEISEETRSFYRGLDQLSHIRVIIDLPVTHFLPSPDGDDIRVETEDAQYLLWASTLHQKTLFNGYSGFVPHEYVRRASFLSAIMPSKAGLTLLSSWGVDAIVLHRDEFEREDEFTRIRDGLIEAGLPPTTETGTLSLFDLTPVPEGSQP